ncbi:MAG TPA: cyclic pyranopterin monophosphate synthase MoaC [Verrucomicrobiae bacterium]|nr:cyclic pyranopterin monophosphate synthase MoaC [Verrucomicrobiae bacterium]
MSKPTHIAQDGTVFMVDVSAKTPTDRLARAQARLRMSSSARQALQQATVPKGDAFVTAQIAGIMAAKRTAELIPLAHPVPLAHLEVTFAWEDDVLCVNASARTFGATGVEMEAMVAATIAALTVYDMTKAVDKGIVIESIRLLEKSGGKSGHWRVPQ